MNLIKTPRKPYIAMFLSALILFVSCSQYENDDIYENDNLKEASEPVGLSNFVEKHLELSLGVVALIKNEETQNILDLKNIEEDLTYELLNEALESANIKESNAIVELIKKMQLNGAKFAENNPNFKNLTKAEIEAIIADEINKQFNNSYLRAAGGCQDAYHTAQGRCTVTYALAAGTAAAAGIFTAGLGFLVGGAVALATFTICMSFAESDLSDCLEAE